MDANRVVIGQMDTQHFQFVSVGLSETQARAALAAAWDRHAAQTGADFTGREALEEYAATFTALDIGEAARDGYPI